MFEGFVNPALVAGVSLATVPLLIHLLNRQRHRPMRWAAMRFVLAAYRKTRRRVQLENLLLLLLRMAAVALLALAVARPFATGDGAFGPLTEKRRDVVLVLDASASTGYREELETVFERIAERANALVAGLDGGSGDRVQIVVAGAWPRTFGWTDPEKALSLLSTLSGPTDEALDLPATLGSVLELVEEDAAGTDSSTLEVRLLTDLQRSIFAELAGPAPMEEPAPEPAPEAVADDPEGEPAAPLLAEQLDALQAFGVALVVEDLGPAVLRPPNLTVGEVRPVEALAGPGGRVEIAVRIDNHGGSARPAERVALVVDGNKLPVQRIDMPAQGSAEVFFSLQLDESGPHTVVGELDGDRLAVDDRRATVVMVPPPVRVLVVNGGQSEDIDDDEVAYFLLALEPLGSDELPGAQFPSPFEPHEVTPDFLVGEDRDLEGYGVILLANVAVLPTSVVEALEQHVARGGSLIIALGDRIADLAGYNQRLFRPDGSGLLPAELVRGVSTARRESYYRVASFDHEHPILSFFQDEAWKPLLTEVPIYSFVHTRPLEDARVLASLDDEARSPLLIERAWDQGRVFLWTTGLSRAWSDVPASPKTLIPLAHEWLRYAGERHAAPRVVAPGEPVRMVVDHFPRSPELARPDQSRRTLDAEPLETPDGRWQLPEIDAALTERVGLYRIDLEGQESEPFAVQLGAAEGNLERLAGAELGGLHPGLEFRPRDGAPGNTPEDGPRRGEIWRRLALLCLLALVAESLWGAWIGQRRRVVR